MAPKRSAQPPAAVASSEETASGSRSRSEEEEEEDDDEEIAHSPPPAAPKGIAPPPRKDQEPEASDEDEDGASDEDEDGEEDGEGDDEEEDDRANHVTPSSATPPPAPAREESETSDEEEEEEEEEADDEAPQTKPAPDQETEAKGAKRPSAPFQRTWSTDDDIRIVEVLAAHRLEHDTLPETEVLANALSGKLDNSGFTHFDLQRKLKSLLSLHTKAVKKGAPPSKDHARRLFDLCKNVWPSVTKVATKSVANGGAGRDPEEMCELYPYLAEEVKALQKAHPGFFKREFAMIDDTKARAMDEKIKKHRHAQMNLHLRHQGLIREVTKTLMDLAE